MREFICRAMRKLHRMSDSQLRDFVQLVADEYALFDAMMDSLTTGVIILNSKHVIIKTNRAASRIFGMPFTETAERPIWRCLPDSSLADFIHTTIENKEGTTGKEYTINTAEGNQYIEISILPLVQEKKVHGTIIMAEDVTQKKREEINKHRLENLASLTNLAAAVAHEIKNPLAAISIHVQLLRKKVTACNAAIDTKAQRHLTVIEEEIDRLNKIVVDFLFAVRPLQCEFAPVHINALIKNVVETFKEEFAQTRIDFLLNYGEKLPPLQADERFLRQAFINILVNAKAAMPSGGTITISTHTADDKLCIKISDTGQGIPPDMLHKIFEPYFTTKPDGSGLGLTMTYKVIKEHSGDIQVHSKIGSGTLFTIILPLSRTEKPLLLEAHAQSTVQP